MSKTIYLEIMSSEPCRKFDNDCAIPYRTRTAFKSVKDNEIYFIEFGVGNYKDQGKVLIINYLIKCNKEKGEDEYINIFDFMEKHKIPRTIRPTEKNMLKILNIVGADVKQIKYSDSLVGYHSNPSKGVYNLGTEFRITEEELNRRIEWKNRVLNNIKHKFPDEKWYPNLYIDENCRLCFHLHYSDEKMKKAGLTKRDYMLVYRGK